MAQVIRHSQSLLQNIWTLLGKDMMVGFEIINFAHNSIEESQGLIPFQIHWKNPEIGDWEVLGRVERVEGHAISGLMVSDQEEE